MEQRTTIQLPRPIIKQLQKFGLKGQTYADILKNMMREIRYREFMERVYEADAEAGRFYELKDI